MALYGTKMWTLAKEKVNRWAEKDADCEVQDRVGNEDILQRVQKS